MGRMDNLNQIAAKEFGVIATWHPAAGGSYSLRGVFEYDYFSETGGVGIQTHKASFDFIESDAAGIAVGDSLTVNGIDFTIKELQPDSQGMTRAVLWKD